MTGFKKKLASSALATAMTLTALPVSVFFISTGAAAEGVPSGFAYAQGTRFMLDGSPFYYAGTNCYYNKLPHHRNRLPFDPNFL